MKYVLFYEASDEVATLAPLHYGAHAEYAAAHHAAGDGGHGRQRLHHRLH